MVTKRLVDVIDLFSCIDGLKQLTITKMRIVIVVKCWLIVWQSNINFAVSLFRILVGSRD